MRTAVCSTCNSNSSVARPLGSPEIILARSCHRSNAKAADTSVCFASAPFTSLGQSTQHLLLWMELCAHAWSDFVSLTAHALGPLLWQHYIVSLKVITFEDDRTHQKIKRTSELLLIVILTRVDPDLTKKYLLYFVLQSILLISTRRPLPTSVVFASHFPANCSLDRLPTWAGSIPTPKIEELILGQQFQDKRSYSFPGKDSFHQ